MSVFVRNCGTLRCTQLGSGHQAMVHTVRPGKYGARKGRGIGSPKPRDKASSRHWTLAPEIAERWQRWQRCQRKAQHHTLIHHRFQIFQMLKNAIEDMQHHATCNTSGLDSGYIPALESEGWNAKLCQGASALFGQWASCMQQYVLKPTFNPLRFHPNSLVGFEPLTQPVTLPWEPSQWVLQHSILST